MIRKAHGVDIALCSDKACRFVHVVLKDEENEAFAEAEIDPMIDAVFFEALLSLCFHLRVKQQLSVEPPIPH